MITILENGTREVAEAVEVRWNLAAGGKQFRCKFLEPGLVSYRDVRGGGIELLRKETIDEALTSFVGNPVTVLHTVICAENRLNHEQGIVHGAEYDPTDGWFHCNGALDTDLAIKRVREGWRPSCGYVVLEFGPGGKYHGIDYDREIKRIRFNHLAIVPKARYEVADFRLNSLNVSHSNNMQVFTFLKKLVTRANGADGKATETVKVDAVRVPAETEIEIDGKPVRTNALVDSFLHHNPAPDLQVAADDEIELPDGRKVAVSTMVESFRKNGAAPVAAAAAKTDEPAATEVKDAAGKTSFFTLRAARHNAAAAPTDQVVEPTSKTAGTLSDRVSVGQARYGSPSK